MLRIDQLESLIEISKHKSINAASEVLNMTPQGLSMSIKQLEKELGFQILERSAIGSTLTSQGNAVVDATMTFINSINAIKSNPQKLTSFPSEITLYMPYGLSEGMPSLRTTLYKLSPHSHIFLREEPSNHQSISKVFNEEVEFAFVRELFIEGKDMFQDIPSELVFTPFFSSRCYCCGSRIFPILRYKSVSLKSIVKYPLILFEPTKEMDLKIFESVCPLERMQIIWAQNALVYNEFVKSGAGIGISMHNQGGNIITSYAKDLPDTVIVPIKESIILSWGYIVKRGKPLKDTTNNLLNYLKEYFNTY